MCYEVTNARLVPEKEVKHVPYYPSNRKYEKANILPVRVAFNRKTEPELVERIEREPRKSTYIKRLVREDVEREKRKGQRE